MNRVSAKTKNVIIIMLIFILTLIHHNFGVLAEENVSDSKKPAESIISGSQVDESKVTAIYYVDGENDNASDKNDGTEKSPFRTIEKAVGIAVENNKEGIGTKIIIAPGTYREAIALVKNGEESDAPIIIEGMEDGDVIIKGSIVFGDPWEYSNGVYSHKWLMDWQVGRDIYFEDGYDIKLEEIVRRREMIFVDGEMLTQVLSEKELKPGSFYVDNKKKLVSFKLDKEIDLEKSIIEIPIREYGIKVDGKSNVVLRGLTVSHTNSYFYGPAGLIIDNSKNVLIDKCNIDWNNGAGMTVFNSNNVTIFRTTANYNGSGGLVGYGDKNILMIDSETSYNNWRGVKGDFVDWHSSGIKILFSYSFEILRHKAIGNFAPGIWFDSEIQDIYIRDSIVKDNNAPGKNVVAGIYLEGGLGPFLVSGCEITGNKRGFNLASSTDITITDCIIADNLESQIGIFANWGLGRTFHAFEGGGEITSYLENTIIKDSIISAPDTDTGVIFDYDHGDIAALKSWLKTLKTENLKYFHPEPNSAFYMPNAETKGSLKQWQQATGLDGDALWIPAPPKGLKILEQTKRSVSLEWEEPSTKTGVKGYKVYHNGKEIGDTEKLTFVYSYKQKDGDSVFFVKSYDEEGNESVDSNHVQLTEENIPKKGSNDIFNPLTLALLVIILAVIIVIVIMLRK